MESRAFLGPSSPDLNPIEKVWRWIKEELKKLPYVPKNKEDLKREVQKLWDQVDPRDFRHYTNVILGVTWEWSGSGSDTSPTSDNGVECGNDNIVK